NWPAGRKNYAAPIWTPGTNGTQMKKLQACQNTDLMTATGNLLMSPEHHLHREASMLRVKEHNALLLQAVPTGMLPQGEAEPPPRHIRKGVLDLRTRSATLDRTAYRQALNAIHQESVNTFMNSLPVNGELGEIPPPIADNELEMRRETA
ncbi:unnamed protein product, partial [Ceratitis capitata]